MVAGELEEEEEAEVAEAVAEAVSCLSGKMPTEISESANSHVIV